MGSILTSRQTLELHRAIAQYLEPLLEDNKPLYTELTAKLGVNADAEIVPNYLEKKWSTVLRLQKKILDLENEVNSYKALLDSARSNNGGLLVPKDKHSWLPSNSTKTFPTQTSQIVNSVALHPTLPLVTAGCADGSIIAWNLASQTSELPEKVLAGHTRSVHKIKWSYLAVDLTNSKAKSHVMASCSLDLSIKIWEGDRFKHIRTLTGHEHTVSSIAFSPCALSILYSVSRDKSVKIWDLEKGYCIKTFVGHSDWVRDIDVASINSALLLSAVKKSNLDWESDYLLTCSSDQSARLSHNSGTGIALLVGHTHVVEAAKFLPMYSNTHIDRYILLNLDRFLYLLEAVVQNPVYQEKLGFKYCVTAGRDNLMKLWLLVPPTLQPHRPPMASNQNNSHAWHIADIVGHQLWVKSLEVHPNGRFIISASDDKSICIWDLAGLVDTGKVTCVKSLLGHEGFVNSVNFAGFELAKMPAEGELLPEEREKEAMEIIEQSLRCLFASGGTDNTVRLWS